MEGEPFAFGPIRRKPPVSIPMEINFIEESKVKTKDQDSEEFKTHNSLIPKLEINDCPGIEDSLLQKPYISEEFLENSMEYSASGKEDVNIQDSSEDLSAEAVEGNQSTFVSLGESTGAYTLYQGEDGTLYAVKSWMLHPLWTDLELTLGY